MTTFDYESRQMQQQSTIHSFIPTGGSTTIASIPVAKGNGVIIYVGGKTGTHAAIAAQTVDDGYFSEPLVVKLGAGNKIDNLYAD